MRKNPPEAKLLAASLPWRKSLITAFLCSDAQAAVTRTFAFFLKGALTESREKNLVRCFRKGGFLNPARKKACPRAGRPVRRRESRRASLGTVVPPRLPARKKEPRAARLLFLLSYSMISVTTPEPTVLPPSLMANLRPSSIAIGVIRSISIVMLSPGMHISTPSGSFRSPVTSVVLK